MDATEVLIDIRKIVRSINLESKRIQKDYGVSIPQVLCLNYLYQSPGFQATQGDLKKFLHLNPSTTSGIVNRLEKKGLIARLPKLGDKRVTNLALTAQGEKLLKQIPALLHDRLSIKLQNLPSNELEQIRTSFRKLVNILQIDNIEASPLLTTDELI
ncbi:MAG TPA: MarR family transcriptional regulator [Prolixibacteraceae bacterium]|mgnify:CR=1 FL=1|nr:MarR family transcriptional regulator [Prolixibacteraceae bacterium]HPR59623.1 MarR family transcriptional regulator [Prolixibacteraceae bacterium]